jgi:hypothetical protein
MKMLWIAAVIVAMSASAFGQNLIHNPSFETDDDSNGYPDDWGSRSYASWETNAEHARTGSASLKLTGPSDPTFYYLYNMGVPNLKENTKYILRAYVKTSGLGADDWVKLRHTSDPYPPTGHPTTGGAGAEDTEWTMIDVNFTTTDNSGGDIGGRVDIMCSLSQGVAWIDDVTLIEVVPAKVKLEASATSILADGSGFSVVTAKLYDAYDNFLNTAEAEITFALSGPGSLAGVNPVQSVNGVATITYQSSTQAGTATVSATAPGLQSDEIDIQTTNFGHNGVPTLPIDYSLDVEDWWREHPFNPASPNYKPNIFTETPVVNVNDHGGDVAAAIAALPADGGTILFPDGGTYHVPTTGIKIEARNNIHFVSDGRATVTVPAGFNGVPNDNGGYNSVLFQFQSVAGDWHDDNYANDAALANPIRNFYFKNLVFDADGQANTIMNFWTTNDVVFDNCEFRGGVTQEIHIGAWCDNFWARGCFFTGDGSHAVVWDGTHGSGFLNCKFDFDYHPVAIVFLSNDDCSRDVIDNGVWDDKEVRLGAYIAVVNNVFGENGSNSVEAIAASTRRTLVKDNVSYGNGPRFFGLAPRCTQMGISPTLNYEYYDNRLVGNTTYGTLQNFAVFRTNPDGNCVPTTAYSRTGKYEVRGNVVHSVMGDFVKEEISAGNPMQGPNLVCGNCVSDPNCSPKPWRDCRKPEPKLSDLGRYVNSGATFHLDGATGDDMNDGTETAPWATIEHAIAELPSASTLVIHEGVYETDGTELLIDATGVSENQATIIRAAEGERVIVTSNDGSPPPVRVRGDYYRIEGIWFGGAWETGGEFQLSGGGRVDHGREFVGNVFFGYNCVRGGLVEHVYFRKNRFVRNGVGNDPPVLYMSGDHGIGYSQHCVIDDNIFVTGKGYAVNGWHSFHNFVITRNFFADIWGGVVADGRGSEYQGNVHGSHHLVANNTFWACKTGDFNGATLIAPNFWFLNNILVDESNVAYSANATYGWQTLENTTFSSNAFLNVPISSRGDNAIDLSPGSEGAYFGTEKSAVRAAIDAIDLAFQQSVADIFADTTIDGDFAELDDLSLPEGSPLIDAGEFWVTNHATTNVGTDCPAPGATQEDFYHAARMLGWRDWNSEGNMVLRFAEDSFTDGSGTTNYRGPDATNDPLDFKVLVQPEGASYVTLTFEEFDVESGGDYVHVYDGAGTDAPSLGSFTGSTLPSSLTTTGGAALVHFETDDDANTGQGWRISYTSDSPLDVEEESDAPRSFALTQNYPNPFNPVTRIAFELPDRRRVRLAVYDALGRETAVLVEGVYDAGKREARFDGSALATGVYFAVLEAVDLESGARDRAAIKMLLIK